MARDDGTTNKHLGAIGGWLAVAILCAILVALRWGVTGPTGYDVAIAGGPYVVGTDAVTKVVAERIIADKADASHADTSHTETLNLDKQKPGDGDPETRVRFTKAGDVAVDIVSKPSDPVVHRNVHVVPLKTVVGIAVVLSLLGIALPIALAGSPSRGRSGAWYQLLSEKSGGFSLARVQLLVWFFPAAVLYGALAFALQDFVAVSSQMAILLGLSGATTLLGTAASPPAATRAPSASPTADEAAEPDLRDIVTGWDGNGDFSRYQYLFLSVVGAIVMVIAFWRRVEMPELPSQFLYLVAGSQGTYLATKAIKVGKMLSDGSANQAVAAGTTVSVKAAPVTKVAAAPGTDSDQGSFRLGR